MPSCWSGAVQVPAHTAGFAGFVVADSALCGDAHPAVGVARDRSGAGDAGEMMGRAEPATPSRPS
jgi:hypothetical protein